MWSDSICLDAPGIMAYEKESAEANIASLVRLIFDGAAGGPGAPAGAMALDAGNLPPDTPFSWGEAQRAAVVGLAKAEQNTLIGEHVESENGKGSWGDR